MDSNKETNTAKARWRVKTLVWDVSGVVAIIAALYFGKLWYSSSATAEAKVKEVSESSQRKIKELEQQNSVKDARLAENAQVYTQTYKHSAEQFTTNIESKDSKITNLRRDIVQLNQEKLEVEQRWRAPLKDALDISQDIYSMKWDENSQVLSDMENRSARAVTICQKWEELCEKLEPYPEFSPQLAKLKIRLAQAYSGLGYLDRINFDEIDWEVSGMADRRSEIETHVWYKVADSLIKAGKHDEAKKYSALAKASAEGIQENPNTPGKSDYYIAMTHLLDADLNAEEEPKQAMESYLLACENLSGIMTSFPANTRVKDAFIQACIDGSALGDSFSNAGNAEKLNKEAYKKILALIAKHPEIERPKEIFAEAKIKEAEELILNGDQAKAEKMLDEARAMVKKSGGDVLLTASIDSTQAFIYWDNGQRTKAIGIMDSAISKVKKLKAGSALNKEAIYSLSSLYWVRSSMKLQPKEAIEDGQTAIKYLVELVQSGAGKREAAARRMMAIIYSDIGEQAYISSQKTQAKKYFVEARQQWEFLTKKWGATDEYTEGERWCSWRIKSL